MIPYLITLEVLLHPAIHVQGITVFLVFFFDSRLLITAKKIYSLDSLIGC